ncbi:hypothetical protein Pmani_010964 [Petrolisthes manimaculis]|uniref:Uncharacterized protein n=1 Tax=Petrolisthes manimaculis TaxID=1843537 RepID=A0AAE1Q3Y1_9EUCA|nr:hypothetical protein Pmani_010964 [Petrolisthes manimaculis]
MRSGPETSTPTSPSAGRPHNTTIAHIRDEEWPRDLNTHHTSEMRSGPETSTPTSPSAGRPHYTTIAHIRDEEWPRDLNTHVTFSRKTSLHNYSTHQR